MTYVEVRTGATAETPRDSGDLGSHPRRSRRSAMSDLAPDVDNIGTAKDDVETFAEAAERVRLRDTQIHPDWSHRERGDTDG